MSNSHNNRAVQLDGSTTYFTIPIVPDHTNGFAFSAWVYTENNSVFKRIFSWNPGGDTDGFELRKGNTNFIQYVGWDNGTITFNNTSATITPNVWTHLAGWYAPNNVALYMNGSQIFADTSCSMSVATTSFYLGRAGTTVSTTFEGLIDNVIFRNSSIWGAQEINDLYNKIIPGTINLLVTFEGAATDQSGNANDLTVFGTPVYPYIYY